MYNNINNSIINIYIYILYIYIYIYFKYEKLYNYLLSFEDINS